MADIFDKIPPHGLVHDWLGPDAVEQLLRFAQSQKHTVEDSSISRGETDIVDRAQRVSKKLKVGNFKTELRAKLTELLPVMFDRLGMKPFRPSKIELDMVAHGDGAFFARHSDITQAARQRVISAVYYFHSLPKAFSGGVLRLHSLAASGRQGSFVDILPDYDTLVFFPSFFPHEVLSVRCPSGRFMDSRFAINFWVSKTSNGANPQ